jgi:formate dehydrogenase
MIQPLNRGHEFQVSARDAAGTREIRECYFEGRPIRDEYLIVDKGKLAGTNENGDWPTKEALRF